MPAAIIATFGEGCAKAIALTDDIDGGRGRLVVVTDSLQSDKVAAARPGNPLFHGLTSAGYRSTVTG